MPDAPDRTGPVHAHPQHRHHSPAEPPSDFRSRLAIGAHAVLISLAGGAVTALLSGTLRAF
ncbi:hypothetical protein LV780_10195 [Cereibacter azotoformans]|uniref:Uncharacterized protein n=1 Tax=Cereibacter azotoformans TaxID=43057 RepID=A0A2T5KC53_9RHOB|nr:hypothetical protein [Cereibacter azotoformans]AXQ94137.1 hypothetical protein D0Z66_10210 [Cereibacter sphaeroides]MBO4168059.1 hypothetical protein [Cereibacter azotoformans]PTR19995.1 hypothetical protein C8J28_103121 [Cereibacter azotoformans]UIJ29671.1 hypothetical protein LV780_10195 [Cereibacter azotoformans]